MNIEGDPDISPRNLPAAEDMNVEGAANTSSWKYLEESVNAPISQVIPLSAPILETGQLIPDDMYDLSEDDTEYNDEEYDMLPAGL
jgi:hypothetical protein